MIKVMDEILPGKKNLSSSTKDAKKMIKDLGLLYLIIHASVNNCMLF